MTLLLIHALKGREITAVAAAAQVNEQTVRNYLAGKAGQRPSTVVAIETALRRLGFVQRRARPTADKRTLSLPFGAGPRRKGEDEEQ